MFSASQVRSAVPEQSYPLHHLVFSYSLPRTAIKVLSRWMCISLKAGSIRRPFASIAFAEGLFGVTAFIFPFAISTQNNPVLVATTSFPSYSNPVSSLTFSALYFCSFQCFVISKVKRTGSQ